MLDRISGRIISVEHDRDGSPVASAAAEGDTVLYMEDASDFTETGGNLVLQDGTKVSYDSADMELDTVTLTSGLTLALDEGTFVKTHPVVVTRWASVEVFGYDDPLNVRIPHHYWPWLKLGARKESKQELVTVIYDSVDWVVFDVDGVAKPKLSDEQATRERIFRYTSEGIGFASYRGVKFIEDYSGTLTACRIKSEDAVTSPATFDLLLNGSSIATMVIPAGSKFSPMVTLNDDFDPGDRLRVEYTTPSDASPNLVMWAYATIDVD